MSIGRRENKKPTIFTLFAGRNKKNTSKHLILLGIGGFLHPSAVLSSIRLKHYRLRTIFQLLIWKHAHICMQHLPDPKEFAISYAMERNQLIPTMMDQPAVASELINEFFCECSDDCDEYCRCQQHGQPCTASCACGEMNYEEEDRACVNPLTLSYIVEESDDI